MAPAQGAQPQPPRDPNMSGVAAPTGQGFYADSKATLQSIAQSIAKANPGIEKHPEVLFSAVRQQVDLMKGIEPDTRIMLQAQVAEARMKSQEEIELMKAQNATEVAQIRAQTAAQIAELRAKTAELSAQIAAQAKLGAAATSAGAKVQTAQIGAGAREYSADKGLEGRKAGATATVDAAKARAKGTVDAAKVRANAKTPPPPKVGDVVNGYKFKGGDPKAQSSWQKV